MKHILTPLIGTFIVLSLSSCSTPSAQPNKKTQKGWMQEHLDAWLKQDWEPTTREVSKKYDKNKKSDSFTLQKFVDKAVAYSHAHPDMNNSHIKKLNKLPAIGN